MSLYQRLDGIAKRMDELETQVRAVGNQPQAQRTSVEGGSIDFNDADGNLKAIVGQQFDGGTTVNVVAGPTPPTPIAPVVEADYGTIKVRWDGRFEGDAIAPTDFSRVQVYAKAGGFVTATPDNAKGSIVSAAGDEVVLGVEKGTWTVCLASWSQAGKVSAMSAPVTVEVPGYGDLVQAAIDEAQRLIDQAKQALEGSQEELAKKIATAETALSELKTSLGDLADTTLPKLREDLTAAEGRLSDAEQDLSDAFGELGAVPGKIDAAKQAAITAAQDDARAKAAAAESAAKAHADLVAEGAEADAIAAAKADAKAKADAAQAAAIAAAALDATQKANAAQSAAEAKAQAAQQRADLANDKAQALIEAGPNLIVNGDFENPSPNIWPNTTYQTGISVVTASHARSGTHVMRVDSSSANRYPLTDWRDSSAGRIYYAEVWCYPNDTDMTYRGRASFYAQAQLKDGSTPGFYGMDLDGKGVYVYQDQMTPGQWNKIAAYITTPADTLRVRVAPHTLRNETPYDFDDFKVIDVTESIGALREAKTAQSQAVAAHAAAGSAQAAADAAMTTANGLSKVLHGTTVPTGIAPNGSVWWQHKGSLSGPVIGQWNRVNDAWVSTPISSEAIANLDVGKLTAGAAALVEAVVQKIAAATASIQQADIRNLFVTGQSTLSTVVAQTIAADVAKFLKIEVGQLLAGTATMDQATVRKLFADVVVAGMAVATEFIGENAILTGAVTASKITASEELWAKLGEFVRIRTGMLEADAINGMFIRGATFETLDGRGRWADDGLTMFDENQDWRVRLTPYGSTFKGDLEAESLVATGPAEFRHTENRLGQGAKLVLDAGVADPTAPPVVQPYWASVGFTPPEGGVLYGLAWADGKYWTFVDVPNASEGDRLISIDPASGAIGDNIPMTDQFWAAGGVTAIGSELFLLGQKSGTPYKYFVRVYSTAGAFLREWEDTLVGWSKTNPLGYKPGIGTDGTNVVIAQCTDAGSLTWRTYNKTTGALLATVDCKDQTKSDIGGIYIGPGDWGGGTFVTVRKTSGNVGDAIVTFSTSGVWDPAKSWKTAENGRDTGLAFADGKFRTLNGGGGRINEYAPPTTGDDSPDWWVAYRWETDFNSDNALDYTSRISPPTRFTWPRRARLKALGSPLPVGVETIGGFTAKKATTPERTDFRRSFTNTQQGKSVALWHYLDSETTVPAEVNTYPTATTSSIVSASNTYEVKGDGTGRWGPLTFNPNGTVTGVPKVASGVVQLNVPSNNGRVSATVTLPAGRFTTKPAIQVTARTAWPVVHAATFTDETTTSFVVWARRDTAGPLDVAWTAIGE
ncbi:Uncharacterised protein [Brevibacterium casei]|uniref:Minor tail protein n=1 Tax=Brevibacterium casei TaxID=33889 RepID=A0A449D7Z3_9MICO|nr:hypothetical protein [Brevibacterium casei]VEW13572.1 Uncharacterised protein [Brevibacterium casei]